MANVIRKIIANGHNVQFFIQASYGATADFDKSGSSETKPDYEVQAACDEINQYVLICPGRALCLLRTYYFHRKRTLVLNTK